MGYTHYFGFGKEDNQNFKIYTIEDQVQKDVLNIIERHKDVLDEKYTIGSRVFVLNGNPAHETLYIEAGNDGFCKTNEKPYDVAVCEILLVFKHHYGEEFTLESDGFYVTRNQLSNSKLGGSWNTALENVKSEFGYEFDLIPSIDGDYYHFKLGVKAEKKAVEHEIEPSYVEAIVDVLTKNNLSYTRVMLYGSYLKNPDTANDIDIIVEYTGNEKEDIVFEMLRGELSLDGLPVDFNPINIDMRGRDEETQPIYFPHYGEGYTKRVPIHYNESFIKEYCDLMFIELTTIEHIDDLIEKYDKDGDVDDESYIAFDGEQFIVCENSLECYVEDFKTLEEAMYWFFKEYDIIVISETKLSVIEKVLNESIAQQRKLYHPFKK